jgi:hypothetical protein
MDYVVAIPSYKRHITLKEKTLKMLNEQCVLHTRIHIFCVPEEEELYKQSCQGYKIIPGVKGLVAQRNFIYDYFPEETKILFIDDDVSDLCLLQATVPFADVINLAFENSEKQKCRLWGIYPVANTYFMKPRMTTDLRYIVGCMFGLIKRGESLMKSPTDDKEDVWNSCAYYKADGKVLRLNFIAPITKYFKEPGGLQETRTAETIREGAVAVKDAFPELCSMYVRKRTGNYEIRLKDKSSKKTVSP